MHIRQYSTRSKIAILLLTLSIIDRGWMPNTHTMGTEEVAIGGICLIRAAAYIGAVLCAAIHNRNDSEFARMFIEETKRKQEPIPTPTRMGRRSASAPSSTPLPAIESPYPSAARYHSAKSLQTGPPPSPNIDIPHHHILTPSDIERLSAQSTETIIADWDAYVVKHAQLPTISIHLPASATDAHSADSRQWYIAEAGPSNITYRTLDNQFYCTIGSSIRTRETSKPWLEAAYEQQREHSLIHHDPNFNAQVKNHINAFTKNGEAIAYGSKLEQIAALLNCPYYQLPGITYGEELADTQRRIYARYFHNDGSLCPRALNDRSAAQKAFLKYPGYNHAHIHAFQKYCVSVTIPHCPNRIRKTGRLPGDITERILNNKANAVYSQMLAAYEDNDIYAVKQLYNQNRDNDIASDLYQQICALHIAAAQQQLAKLKDAHGIYHFNLPYDHRDPLSTQLANVTGSYFGRSVRALKQLNDLLLVRHHAKNILHKAWSIAHDVASVVHQAMYALLDIHTIPERIAAICKFSSDVTKTPSQRHDLVQAFFLSNGILKDFAGYDRARTFCAPLSIQYTSHADTRYLLNHLVYAERIAHDGSIKQFAADAITKLQTALTEQDTEKAHSLLCAANTLYSYICNPQATTPPLPTHLVAAQPTPPAKPATPARPADEALPAPPCAPADEKGYSGSSLPPDIPGSGNQNNHNGPDKIKKASASLALAEAMAEEVKKRVKEAVKVYNHKQTLPHCIQHNTRTYKGMHQIYPKDTKGILLTPEQCDIAVKPFNYTVLSPKACGKQSPLGPLKSEVQF